MTDELRKAVQTALILTEETAKEFADYQNGNNNKSDYGGYGLQYYVDIDNAIKKLTYCDTIPIGIISDVEKIYQTWSNLLPHERRCEFQRYMEVRERETMKFHQIMGFCIDLHRVLEELHNTIERSKTTAATTQQSQPFKPDARLTTDKAQAMFDAFEKAGYIKRLEDGHLEWIKSTLNWKALFGYFVNKVADANCLDVRYKGNAHRKPFEELFKINDSGRNVGKVVYPKGYEKIDEILKPFLD